MRSISLVSCFWDSGFEVKLGDDLNGFAAETRVGSWDEIEPWLRVQALLHYPDSDFAKGMDK